MNLKFICFIAIAASTLFLSNCTSLEGLSVQEQAEEYANIPLIDEETFSKEPELHGGRSLKGPFDIIFFEQGGAIITRKAVEAIKKNVDYLIKNKEINIVLEGYCDISGSPAYNLSLGQRRALEVKRFYVLLGINPARIATVSYGSENPIGKSDSLNRRVETKILIATSFEPDIYQNF
ncbi:MAG: OmpA family protein [Elusimicrobiota bacterium]|jgi:outer membrane protein OmpA-like peptidoglycan-associated protein|nr:OmpA family protein [Elusimicrobiota bacterium]